MSVSLRDIEERWNSRIKGKYDNPDGSGVIPYLQKYGKRISDEKLEKYAEYAYNIGEKVISSEFINNTTYGLFKRLGEQLPSVLNQDFNKIAYFENESNTKEDFTLFHKKNFDIGVFPKHLSFEYFREHFFSFFKTKTDSEFSFAIVSYRGDFGCVIISEADKLPVIPDYQIVYSNGRITNSSLFDERLFCGMNIFCGINI